MRRRIRAIKGAILGDILGSQYKFSRPADLDWKNVRLAGDYIDWTDDTVMTLAVKKAIDNDLDMAQTMLEMGRKYMDHGFGDRIKIDKVLEIVLDKELYGILTG